jgi:hypothetical protein
VSFWQITARAAFGSESDLPESLRPFVATGDETPPFNPSERYIYADLPRNTRRQVRKLEAIAQEKEAAEAEVDQPLREDLQAALEDAHAAHIGRAKAQMAFNQSAIDVAHEAAAAATEPPQLYVRRGGEWAHVERAKLKPGETCFLKRENGEMEAAGVVNSRGEPPPPEITT